jgi:hypothetical protein
VNWDDLSEWAKQVRDEEAYAKEHLDDHDLRKRRLLATLRSYRAGDVGRDDFDGLVGCELLTPGEANAVIDSYYWRGLSDPAVQLTDDELEGYLRLDVQLHVLVPGGITAIQDAAQQRHDALARSR